MDGHAGWSAPAGRAGRHELVEQPPELALDIHVAVRSPDDAEAPVGREPGPDASARPVERDGDPGDQQGERDPDEPLARVALAMSSVNSPKSVRPIDRSRPCDTSDVALVEVDRLVEVLDRQAVRVRPR